MSNFSSDPAGYFDPTSVAYTTDAGVQLCGDSRDLIDRLPDGSVDLIVTSPPFALLTQKEYGNEDQAKYVQWIADFGIRCRRVLKPSGSLILDLGGAYVRGLPVRSLYNYRVLIEFVDNLSYHLAEEFFWYNPAKLPSPAEWVNKRKIRAIDAVNTVWWLSKTPHPKADVRNVLVPYSQAMTKLLDDPESYYKDARRPSSHEVTRGFSRDNGGAIPKNLLQIANTDSNSMYHRRCRMLGQKSHPARFPDALPRFFIKMLTEPGDLVLDIFSGSNTTGSVAQDLDRRWLAFELDRPYCALSAVRFMNDLTEEQIEQTYARLLDGERVDLLKTSARQWTERLPGGVGTHPRRG